MGREADGLDAGDVAHSIGELVLEDGNPAMLAGAEFVPIGVSRRQRKAGGEDVRGLETWRDFEESAETFGHQSCAGEEDQSDRYLGDDERVAHPRLARRNAASVQPDALRLEQRHHPKQDPRRQREERSEREHASIYRDLGNSRQVRRQMPYQRRYTPQGEGKSEGAAQE